MKFLKYTLYFILGLVLVFFALGFLKPSVSYGHEITVSKSIKEAWAVQQDETKFGQWLAGFKSIELISGKQGEVGSTYKVVVKPSEEEPDFEMIETLVAKKDFEQVQLSFDSDMMLFEQTTSFSEVDGETIIKTHSKVSGKGMLMRSMFALMELVGGSFQAQEVKNIETLKGVIEENVTNYNSPS
jgi:hypothetical protein